MTKETAEKKLLRLIEKTDAEEAAKQPKGAALSPEPISEAQKVLASVQGNRAVKGLSLTLPPFLENAVALLQSPQRLKELVKNFGIKEVNAVLFVAIIGILIIYGMNFRAEMMASKEQVSFQSSDALAGTPVQQALTIRDIADYLSTVARRNVFHPFEKKVVEEKDLGLPQESKNIALKLQAYKLVGISWLENPGSATVMFEEVQTQVTHFVRQGEDLDGMTVDQILPDQVILRYQGETMNVNL